MRVEDEILKALDKDPTKRHRTATELIENIKQAYAKTSQPQARRKPQATVSAPPCQLKIMI